MSKNENESEFYEILRVGIFAGNFVVNLLATPSTRPIAVEDTFIHRHLDPII